MSYTARMSPAVPKPEHVPDSVVYDFDTFADSGMIKNAHVRVMEVVREAPPIFWTPRNGGHWVIKSHAAVFKASRDPESFTSESVPYAQVKAMMDANSPDEPGYIVALPINLDPPAHTLYRAPLQSVFSPKSMALLKGDIRALAAELIEAVKNQGRCEFVSDIAEPMPVTVFLRLFGLPVEKQKEYRAAVKEHLSATDFSREATQRRLRKLADMMKSTILDRRDSPRNDIISQLWQTKFEGKPASLRDLENYCVMLFNAGLDTVMNGMGLGACHLAAHPDLQTKLRENPKLISDATEELLRRYTFTLPPRFVAKDMVFDGVPMKKGEIATLFLPAADLDPTQFDSPEQFDLARENKVHIAFGTGPHRCLGSHLARIELQILYEEMLARLPQFHIDPEKAVRYHGGHVWGPNELHLIWNTDR